MFSSFLKRFVAFILTSACTLCLSKNVHQYAPCKTCLLSCHALLRGLHLKHRSDESPSFQPSWPIFLSSLHPLSSLPGLPAISHPGMIVHTNAGKAQINRLTECLWIMQRSFTAVGHKVCLLPNWCVKALKYRPVYLFRSSQGAEAWNPLHVIISIMLIISRPLQPWPKKFGPHRWRIAIT